MAKYGLIDTTNLGPLTTLKIEKPGGGPTDFVKLRGILDTGSPCTYIPKSVADDDLDLSPIGTTTVTGPDGEPRSACVYEVTITLTDPEFARREFRGVRVLDCGIDKALIGRDLLKNFVVVFDGPAQEWRIA